MKKTISGVLLALTAVFALVACGKKTTTKEGETTTKKARKRSGKANIINFYCWNDEFQSRLNTFYGGAVCTNPTDADGNPTADKDKKYQGANVDKVNGSTTVLKNGITIQWTTATNQGSIYQDTLDIALDNNIVDMFCFEADYATKYVASEYVLDLGAAGVDFSDQYKYTVDVVTTADGKKVGSSWQATPGVIIYNQAVADAAFGAANADTVEKMEAMIGKDYATFKTTAASTANKKVTVYKAKDTKPVTYDTEERDIKMVVGPASIYRLYAQNLSGKMYDKATNTITIDKNIFNYANHSKELKPYMAGTTDAYGQWSANWGNEMSSNGATLCVFGCPWFVDFSFKGYRGEDHFLTPTGSTEATDSGWRVCAPYQSFFWGGTWLAATQTSQQESTIKDEVINIVKGMTTNKDVLLDIHAKTKDFTNSKTKMDSCANDTDAYFGGGKVMSKYLASVAKADMSKASDFDQQIAEGFQAAFRTYIDGSATAEACWTEFVSNLKDKTSVKEVKAAAGVTISASGITVA